MIDAHVQIANNVESSMHTILHTQSERIQAFTPAHPLGRSSGIRQVHQALGSSQASRCVHSLRVNAIARLNFCAYSPPLCPVHRAHFSRGRSPRSWAPPHTYWQYACRVKGEGSQRPASARGHVISHIRGVQPGCGHGVRRGEGAAEEGCGAAALGGGRPGALHAGPPVPTTGRGHPLVGASAAPREDGGPHGGRPGQQAEHRSICGGTGENPKPRSRAHCQTCLTSCSFTICSAVVIASLHCFCMPAHRPGLQHLPTVHVELQPVWRSPQWLSVGQWIV